MTKIVGAVLCLAVVVAAGKATQAYDRKALGTLMDDNHCQGCDLSGADLSKAELSGAGLTGANLSNADLRRTILLGATLDDANLKDADLRGAYLDDARFGGADLTGAKLGGARLGGADLSAAIGLTQEQLNQACGGSAGAPFKTLLPNGMTLGPCR
jgi:uncharacterized protein YjbI with pentapeptide repeats